MRGLAERAYFLVCLWIGGLIRSGRYSRVRIVSHGGERYVRKERLFYAPLMVWSSGPVFAALNTGVRVLCRRDWEERERNLYRTLRRAPIRIDAGGALILPLVPGETLGTLLRDPKLEESVRRRAIELAVLALVELHRSGITHADAMADNVLVDLGGGAGHWIDFETIHDPTRPIAWRRADDVRALLATSLPHTAPEKLGSTLDLILDSYSDDQVTGLVAAHFTTALRRSLAFHLGQGPMSERLFREVGRLLAKRCGLSAGPKPA